MDVPARLSEDEICIEGMPEFESGAYEDWIPKPEVYVTEITRRRDHGVGRYRDEIMYRVMLDFGRLGSWAICVNRSNLSSLVSTLQMKKMFGGNAKRLMKRQSSTTRLRRYESSKIGRYASTGPTPSTPLGQAANDRMPDRMSSRMPDRMSSRMPDRMNSRMSAMSEERREKNILYGFTKLLFVPAMGGPSRVRKVKDERLRIVENIFQTILSNETVRNSSYVREFLRISNLTFDRRFGRSYKEGWVKVSVYPRNSEDEKVTWKGKVSCFCCICACAPDPTRCGSPCEPRHRRRRKMWAVVKSSFIAFFANGPASASPVFADLSVLFSHNFVVYKGYGTTGSHRSVTLVEDSKIVKLKFQSRWEKKQWSQAIIQAISVSNLEPGVRNPVEWSLTHENESFAPRRISSPSVDAEICRAKWHVDGHSTFEAIHQAIEDAEYQINIMGWWICADLPLLRPNDFKPGKSFGALLRRKAVEGVQVNILMYNAPTIALPLDSAYQQKEFSRLTQHENIHVLRHPEHKIKPNSTWFWSHHEKLVVVDQRHAFCGGLDICWGRYDSPDHLLFEPNPRSDQASSEKVWPGIDYSNVRVEDFNDVRKYDRMMYPAGCPRMPWHDIHAEYWGSIARDIARHFVQQWNFARFSMSAELRSPSLLPMDILLNNCLVPPSQDEMLHSIALSPANATAGPAQHLATVDENNVIPDENASVTSEKTLVEEDYLESDDELDADDISNIKGELIQDAEGTKSQDENGAAEVDKSQGEVRENIEKEQAEEVPVEQGPQKESLEQNPQDQVNGASNQNAKSGRQTDGLSIRPQEFDFHPRLSEVYDGGYPIDGQVTRSIGLWSGSSPGEKESSLQKSMRSLIDMAKHFVYIENQFFISGLETDSVVANRVLDSLFRRIVRANENKAEFKVFVLIPLLPGFEGSVAESTSIRRVLYYEYRTISRGENSLFHNLLRVGIDPDEYIIFLGLRKWEAYKSASIATELIYIHSKLLIVDDEVCMIGSGNINDRSLTGNRDTEVSVVIRESAGAKNMSERFVKSLRMNLFREHWGNSAALEAAFIEPWKTEHFNMLVRTASTNTDIYEAHFRCIPSNAVRTLNELKRHGRDSSFTSIDYTEEVEQELKAIQGHVVIFPLNFCSKWDLKPAFFEDKNGILGDELFI
eukprot:CAMPEP_0203753546 /NCGR_PEP_ID=MMETSP0098-20131031/7303_1 /ASSEMBLY_ACC=CAM_ASM_000208 /TAXON_ID=96639 /ORGANISM=" , Strain NY0313808BC1" /LENGTH=1158 /DNA_ID=CAMNT_0050644193 /DNA_START=456 /DNA_END=3932 /DNA_ORIENTATION=+